MRYATTAAVAAVCLTAVLAQQPAPPAGPVVNPAAARLDATVDWPGRAGRRRRLPRGRRPPRRRLRQGARSSNWRKDVAAGARAGGAGPDALNGHNPIGPVR